MASPDRMEVDDNSSDGESSGEENPEEMSDKKAWLAWARALTWDASVADDRDCFSVDALPDDDDRRNTAELIADLQTLRQLSETPVADGFRFPEGLGLLEGAPVDFGYDDLDQFCCDQLMSHARAHGMAALADACSGNFRAKRMDHGGFLKRSRRYYWDIGGGGKSRPGYHGEEQWASIRKAADAGDEFAKKLIAFLEKLRTAVSGACGFAVKPRSAMLIKYDHTGGSACDAVWPETTSLELAISEGVDGLLISVRATVHPSHFVQKSRKTNCV
jgi:hypothetical protein